MRKPAPDEKGFHPVWLIHLTGILFLAASFTINPLKITRAFFSDESVYYSMAYSFAIDGDMEFSRKDLIRVYKEFAAGPQGVILKLNERDNTIVYGKSFLYSLVASPFVRLFKTNGFFLFHALLLWLNLLCGYRFCSTFMRPGSATLFSLFYFVANASLVYLYWMTPEYFSMSLVCYAFFFFISGERIKSRLKIFSSPYNYYFAALFFGLATFSKPTNSFLIIPLGLWMLFNKEILRAMIALTLFVVTTVGLFGANVYLTGEWNYQAGNRSVFYKNFPFERPGASEFAPFKQKRQVQVTLNTYRPPFHLEAFSRNWIYFFFGRFSGLAVYFFPMFFSVIYFLFSKKNSLATAVYAAGWIGVLTYMVLIPWNYFGGSGTIGNRYLMNSFSIFLFCLTLEPSRKWLTAGFACSLFFTSPILFTPVLSSFDNAFHQKRSFFKKLPIEKTLLSDLPINTNPRARRIKFDENPTYFAYFMDDNTYYREVFEDYVGFWVKGGKTAQVIIRTFEPVDKLRVRLKSWKPDNRIAIRANGKLIEVHLKEPVFYEREILLPAPMPYDRDNRGATYLHSLKIYSESGEILKLEDTGERYLGAFVRIEIPDSSGGRSERGKEGHGE